MNCNVGVVVVVSLLIIAVEESDRKMVFQSLWMKKFGVKII